METNGARGSGGARFLVTIGLLVLCAPCFAYGGIYAYARATHRLVHYAGGFIARPNAMHGLGWTTWELALAPAAYVEEVTREIVDPTW